MQRLNPTGSLLRARPFVARHDYIFTLLCLLNVNMGALNTSALLGGSETAADRGAVADGGNGEIREAPPELSLEMVLAQGLLDDMAGVFQQVRTGFRFIFILSSCGFYLLFLNIKLKLVIYQVRVYACAPVGGWVVRTMGPW